MKKAQLSGSLRSDVGKKSTIALRNASRVPCVVYGQGEQIHFSVKSVDVQKLIFSPDVFQIEIDIEGGKKVMAIIQDLQMHPVRDTPMHVDFLELNDKKVVKVSLPLISEGSPIGVMNGGKLTQPYRKLRVVGLPGDLPDSIILNVDELRIGDSIRVEDIKLNGVTFREAASAVVLGVKMARGAVDEDEEEETEGEEGTEEGAETSAEEGAES